MCFSSAWTARVSGLAYGLSMEELKAMRPDAMDDIVITSRELNELADRRLDIVPGVLREECLALWTGPEAEPQGS
jgi:hypothetical protein